MATLQPNQKTDKLEEQRAALRNTHDLFHQAIALLRSSVAPVRNLENAQGAQAPMMRQHWVEALNAAAARASREKR